MSNWYQSVVAGCIGLVACAAVAEAVPQISFEEIDKNPLQKRRDVAKGCRDIGIKLDWLGRYQDRDTCTQNLEGSDMYLAAYYVDDGRGNEAKSLLEKTFVRVNYATDIGCYGQNDLKQAARSITQLIEHVNDDDD